GEGFQEDVDRRTVPVLGDEVLAIERHRDEPGLQPRDVLGRRRETGQEQRWPREHVCRDVGGVGQREDSLPALELLERDRDAVYLLERRWREQVVGAKPDHDNVVAPEGLADLLVVGDVRIMSWLHQLERALESDMPRVEAEPEGQQQRRG